MKNNYSEKFIVEKEDCISEINSALPSVLGTYILVKWMEIVCARLINKQLDTNSGMAKRGDEVMIRATIEEQSKREVLFTVVAMLGEKEIVKASHTRVVISKKVVAKMMGE